MKTEACPTCGRAMEPHDSGWTCNHGRTCNDLYRPDSRRQGRWRVYRNGIWAPVAVGGKRAKRKPRRDARAETALRMAA